MWKRSSLFPVILSASWCAPVAAQATHRVSLDSAELQSNGDSFQASVSADGRYLAFRSLATNLVPGDTNGIGDLFVRDLLAGTTERVSLDSGGVEANGESYEAVLSADGRFVAFRSIASNLVPGDTNAKYDVFVRDLLTGVTERVSVDSGSCEADDDSIRPAISADGRYVAFESRATTLVAGDTNMAVDVFVRDRQLGTTVRVSVDSGGAAGDNDSVGA